MWRVIFLIFPLVLPGVIHSFENSYFPKWLIDLWNDEQVLMDETHDQIWDEVSDQLGEEHLFYWGLAPEKTESGVMGKGEVSDKVRVTGMNGMLNRKQDCHSIVQYLSDLHGGVNIHYTYWDSQGWTKDLISCLAAKTGRKSEACRQMALVWKKLIIEMGGVEGGGEIIHYCHSIGCVTSKLAKELLSLEEQKMIRVYAFGPASIIANQGFKEVTNYISVRDGVSMLDPVNYAKALDGELPHVIFVGTLNGPPLIEHAFIDGIYLEILESLGARFQSEYGTINHHFPLQRHQREFPLW